MTALSGLVVADFSRVLAAPYATMLLADLGADVTRWPALDCPMRTRASSSR
jgi:crotonobetainyl-CoA:carnitine CoA-transferase CaiB-like acyl-CoA transferase